MAIGDIHPCIRRLTGPGIDAPQVHSEKLYRQAAIQFRKAHPAW